MAPGHIFCQLKFIENQLLTLQPGFLLCAVLRHPDKNPGNEDEAKIAFQRVHAAYQLLMKGPDYDSDGEESDSDDMDSDEAFACFMDMYATSPYLHQSPPLSVLVKASGIAKSQGMT